MENPTPESSLESKSGESSTQDVASQQAAKGKTWFPIVVGAFLLGGVLGGALMKTFGAPSPKSGVPLDGAEALCVSPSASGNVGLDQQVLAEIDGKAFYLKDFSDEVQDAIYEAQYETYNTIKNILRRQLALGVLAKDKTQKLDLRQNFKVEDLVTNSAAPTDEELKAIYEANKVYFGDKSFDDVKLEIAKRVGEYKRVGELDRIASEYENQRFVIKLNPPLARVVNLDLSDLPSVGSPSAAHTVTIVTDFLCGHCRRGWASYEQAMDLAAQSKDLKIVHITFPLGDGIQTELAKAAYCVYKAKGEGAYFKYTSRLMKESIPQSAYKEFEPYIISTLKDFLSEDEAQKCLKDESIAQVISAKRDMLARQGVNGTPTIFIDNRKEYVVNLLERLNELLRKK